MAACEGAGAGFGEDCICYLHDRSADNVTKSALMGRGDRLDITGDLPDPGATYGDPDTVISGTGVDNDQPVQGARLE